MRSVGLEAIKTVAPIFGHAATHRASTATMRFAAAPGTDLTREAGDGR